MFNCSYKQEIIGISSCVSKIVVIKFFGLDYIKIVDVNYSIVFSIIQF